MIVAVTAGCASPGPAISPPVVHLESVELDKLGLYGQTFLLRLSVSNPNSFPLPVTSVRYEVRLDDRRFAGGETRGGFIVAARDAGNFAISVEVDLLQSASGFNALIESGMNRTMRYELEGSLGVDIPGALRVPFGTSGNVRLSAHDR